MSRGKGFVWAYVTLIVPTLVKYFYQWLVLGNLDLYLLALICISSVAYVAGSRTEAGEKRRDK